VCLDIVCLDIACLDIACLDIACLDIACLDIAFLDIACLDIACLDIACLDIVCLDIACLRPEGFYFDHSAFESQKAFQPKLFIVLFYVSFVCKCVLCYCHRVSTQLQLKNISYHVKMVSMTET